MLPSLDIDRERKNHHQAKVGNFITSQLQKIK